MALVFQYGSNCDRQRLNDVNRLDGAATNPVLAVTTCGYAIAFNVWSNGNGCAASSLVPAPGQRAWGVLYEVPNERITGKHPDGLKTLAQIEGNRYEPITISVRTQDGVEHQATTFLVKEAEQITGRPTSAAYVRYIVNGLRECGAPHEYISQVIDLAINTNEGVTEKADCQTEELRRLQAEWSLLESQPKTE